VVGHEHVQATELLDGRRDTRLDRVGVGEIHLDGEDRVLVTAGLFEYRPAGLCKIVCTPGSDRDVAPSAAN